MKKQLAWLLIPVILLSLWGCGNDDTNKYKVELADAIDFDALLAETTPAPDAMLPVEAETPQTKVTRSENLLSQEDSTFEIEGIENPKFRWGWFMDGKLTLSDQGQQGKALAFSTVPDKSDCSPALDIYKYVQDAGIYESEFFVKLLDANGKAVTAKDSFIVLIRGIGANADNSFIHKNEEDRSVYEPDGIIETVEDGWFRIRFDLHVQDGDLREGNVWIWCLDWISPEVKTVLVDNASFRWRKEELITGATEQTLIGQAQTWVASEMTLLSEKTYEAPVTDCLLDLKLTKGNRVLTVPGFWDGDNIWRIRFALPEAGTWQYETVCSDAENTALHGIKGTVECTAYDGDLAIYKHGFVTTQADKRYFTYADGTPFFYLGDTHWNFLAEEYDAAGEHAGSTGTSSHFKYIVNKRVAQGFTVYQTQPIGADFDVTNGITANDIMGFRKADRYFHYIAKQGLVHANAQFFSPVSMLALIEQDNCEAVLETAARYWIARFGAYPCLWTLGQDVDNDFYYKEYSKINYTMNSQANAYRKVCEYLYRYDPLKQPISAQQESAQSAGNYTTAVNSAFRDCEGHTWWASQWKTLVNNKPDFSVPLDYWKNGQNKPAVLFAGNYENVTTDGHGARAQGWKAFLSGMCGYGYGVSDMHLYRTVYEPEGDVTADGITVTKEQQTTVWSKSIDLPSAQQLRYMKDYLEQYEWWELTPTFDEKTKFRADCLNYACAYKGDELIIIYFSDAQLATGSIWELDRHSEYAYSWFNPRTGKQSEWVKAEQDKTTAEVNFTIGDRPSEEDWVLTFIKL